MQSAIKEIMKKIQFKKRQKDVKLPSRITNETVAEHRERILAGGRRFKYPLQYSRHKLVINTILISIVALILIVAIFWQQLYMAQNSSNFFYRVTRVVPVPVANVDGKAVRYSDYLMRYRSSLHALENMQQLDISTDEGKRQAESFKKLAMDSAVSDAYAAKLAEENSVDISQDEIDKFYEQSRSGLSQDAYDSVAMDLLNWNPEEAHHMISQTLLRQAVAFAIDDEAATIKRQVEERIRAGDSLDEIAKALGDKVAVVDQGFIPVDNDDGGLTAAAAKLEKDKISGSLRPTIGDGYYFVQKIDEANNQVHFKFLKIPLTEFSERLTKLREADKVNYYIKLEGND